VDQRDATITALLEMLRPRDRWDELYSRALEIAGRTE
jgi:hypothetical protein